MTLDVVTWNYTAEQKYAYLRLQFETANFPKFPHTNPANKLIRRRRIEYTGNGYVVLPVVGAIVVTTVVLIVVVGTATHTVFNLALKVAS
jgi:hypothetical protein